MGEVNIDQVVDVPDTPDKSFSDHSSRINHVLESGSSGQLGYSHGICNELSSVMVQSSSFPYSNGSLFRRSVVPEKSELARKIFEMKDNHVPKNDAKGKRKTDAVDTLNSYASSNSAKISFCGNPLLVSSSHPLVTPRKSSGKKLIQNGMISPQSNSDKSSKSSQDLTEACIDLDKDLGKNSCSSNQLRMDIVSEDSISCDVKESGSASVSCLGSGSAIDISSGGSISSCEELSGGWRRTHCFANKAYHPNQSNDVQVLESDDTSFSFSDRRSEFHDLINPCGTIERNHINKKQRTHVDGDPGCSSTVAEKPEVMFVGSLHGSSETSVASKNNLESTSLPVSEIVDLSHEIEQVSSRALCANSNETGIHETQVVVDEILACDLQEQLYNEVLVGGEGSIVYPHERSRRGSRNIRGNNRIRFHVPSTRRSRLGNRLGRQVPRNISRNRSNSNDSLDSVMNILFSSNMDLETRLHILETLDDADAALSNREFLQTQRDFNENDYEMLLALDDSNQDHGVSTDQINTFPESIVQTDNFEEFCAVCLEIPAFGETIRHLPCLHKFHKDCIDPWLNRRTLCPICKSSVT